MRSSGSRFAGHYGHAGHDAVVRADLALLRSQGLTFGSLVERAPTPPALDVETSVPVSSGLPGGALGIYVPFGELGLDRPAPGPFALESNTYWKLQGREHLGLALIHFEMTFTNLGAAALFTVYGAIGDDLSAEVPYSEISLPSRTVGSTSDVNFRTTVPIPFVDPIERLEFGIRVAHDAGSARTIRLVHLAAWYQQLATLIEP